LYHIRYMNLYQIGQYIKEVRSKSEITQADLAKSLGMSRATISQLENGIITDLGIRKLGRICNRLGLEIVVQELPRLPTLHEAYAENKREREKAYKETDAIIEKMNHYTLYD